VSRPTQGTRHDPRDVAELRSLGAARPELAAAAALQIELVEACRRVQTRVATTPLPLSAQEVDERLRDGRRLVDFDQLPIDWSDARLLFRQVTDALRRHDALDARGATTLQEVGRGSDLPALARRWFDEGSTASPVEMLDEILAWSMRPYLGRAADVIQQRTTFAGWQRGDCPVCSGEPDMAWITTSAERFLVCGRCQTRWPTDPLACPFCGERDKGRITSFATPDGAYRVSACQSCRRYLKTLDGRRAGRPVLPALDAIATLPLDAVVLQRGFRNS
jgi:FdhE protein